jgi:hypothetical protein
VLSLNRADPAVGRTPRARDAGATRPPDDVSVARGVSAEPAPPAPAERGTVRAPAPGIQLARRDAHMLALAARTRCADPLVDQERCALLGEVYAAGLDLARQLREHVQHSMVEHRGSHGAWDVMAESEALVVAHDRYAAATRRVAARLRTFIPAPDDEG